MSVETRSVPQVTEIVHEVKLKSLMEYDRDIGMAVAKLALLSDMTLEERRQAAYAIVAEEIPDDTIRSELRDRYYSESVDFGVSSNMQMLDGGYTQMWAAARTP